jgi:hypothetical protein
MQTLPLHSRLDAGLRFSPRYKGKLADHRPMSLHALHSLGASDAELDAFAAHYESDLELRASYPDFEVSLKSVDATAPLDSLMPFVGADAFHPLIRLGHAFTAKHEGEVQYALAYWRCAGLRVLPASYVLPKAERELTAWLEALEKLPQDHQSLGLISDRMEAYSKQAEFLETAASLRVDDARGTLTELARAIAARYVNTQSFTVLHGLTSAYAMFVLLPRFDEPELAVRHYASALAAAICSDRQRFNTPESALKEQPWTALVAAAIASMDEHDSKMIYTCREWHALLGDAVFLRAAQRCLSH